MPGCGSKGLNETVPRDGFKTVRLEGPWKNGQRIPRRYTCDGANVAPRFGATEPNATREVAIVMTDPDAPGGTFVHWTHWGESTEGRNSFGKLGYSGPCPPRGDKPHHYVITFYALRRPLGLAPGSSPDQVLSTIRKSAFASGSVTGLYGR
jgi:phosphatidylethanolamine-binding protein (PEBP) family uncharacterized protein